MARQTISAIYAVSENGVIGKDGDLPWTLKDDLKFFMKTTTGHSIIMGRKSYEALGKALPNRRNIVITRQKDYKDDNIEVVHSLENALELVKGESEVFITGGAGIYRESIEKGFVNKIYETLVHAEVEGDTFFQLPNPSEWEIVDVDAHQADKRNEFAYTFRTLLRNSEP